MITSVQSQISYLRSNYKKLYSSAHQSSIFPSFIKTSSAIIPILLPGKESTVSCFLTLCPKLRYFHHQYNQLSTSAGNFDYHSSNQILERIIQLNENPISPSILVSLSDLIRIRVYYSINKSQSKLPLDSLNPLVIDDYQQIQYLRNKSLSTATSTFQTCGILSIPPYFDHQFNSLQYYSECLKIFYPTPVFPIFYDKLVYYLNYYLSLCTFIFV